MHIREISARTRLKRLTPAPKDSRRFAIVALAAGALFAIITAPPVLAEQPGPVVATVGTHKITQAQVDEKIKPQMAALDGKIYDLKHEAIESLADDYLLEQAAAHEHLSVDEYVKKFIIAPTPKVTDAEAKQYFDAHKGTSTVTFPQIKDRLLSLMQNQRDSEQRDKLLAGLRKSEPLKILLKPPRIEVASAGTSRSWSRGRAGNDRRVLGLPVPLLRTRGADRQAGHPEVRRQGAPGVCRFSAADA